PVPARDEHGMAADIALVLPLREHPEAGREAGGLVPVHRGGAPLRGDRRVDELGLLVVDRRVLPRRPRCVGRGCRRRADVTQGSGSLMRSNVVPSVSGTYGWPHSSTGKDTITKE